MSAYALVDLTHQPGSAWEKEYVRSRNNKITLSDIAQSINMSFDTKLQRAFLDAVLAVQEKWPNALKLLEDS